MPSCTIEPAPFDALAAGYDDQFTNRPLGRWLRDNVRARIAPLLRDGMHALELGCGTGEDAIWLAGQGVRVTATDASGRMLEVAAAKVARMGVGDRVRLERIDLDQAAALAELRLPPVDLVFSNFGVLNCVRDRTTLASTLGGFTGPRSTVALTVMGPWCPWEVLWYLRSGQVRTAFRRVLRPADAQLTDDASVHIDYPSTRRLCREFAPHFRHEATYGIGSVLRPSYAEPFTRRWPRTFARAARLDAAVAAWMPFRALNDHYLEILTTAGGQQPKAR